MIPTITSGDQYIQSNPTSCDGRFRSCHGFEFMGMLKQVLDWVSGTLWGCSWIETEACDSVDERVLVVRSKDEVHLQQYVLRCCIRSGVHLPHSCFVEVVWNKGSRKERRFESKESQPANDAGKDVGPVWNCIFQATGVNIHNLPNIDFRIMESCHLGPMHLGSAFLHLDTIVDGVVVEELPVETTPIFHSQQPPLLLVAYQMCLPHTQHVDLTA